MTSTTSTKTVLHAAGWTETKGDTERAKTLKMLYVADITGEDEDARLTELALDPDMYREMDEPETITITIEVGDLLNVSLRNYSEAEQMAINKCPTPFYHKTHNYCPNCPWNIEQSPL